MPSEPLPHNAPMPPHGSPHVSFGRLVRARRRQLGLTQRQLSQAVACAEITLRKIEADQRLASPQLAQLLVDSLRLDAHDRERYIRASLIEALRPAQRAPVPHAAALPQADSSQRYLAMGDLLLRHYNDAVTHHTLHELAQAHDSMRALFEQHLHHDHKAAQRLAGGLYEYWLKRNLLTEGRGWCEQSLMLDASAGIERSFALLGAGALAAFQSDYAHARGRLDECIAAAEALPRDAGGLVARVLAFALHMRGWVALHAGEPYADITRSLAESSAAFDALGDRLRGAHVGCDLAMAHTYTYAEPGISEGRRCAERALAVFQELGSDFGAALAMGMLAETHIVTGDRARISAAQPLAEHALQKMRDAGNDRDVAWALLRLSEVHRGLGDLDQAQTLTEQALPLFHRLSEKTALCFCMQNLAQVLRLRGDAPAARKRLAASLTLAHELHNRPTVLRAFMELLGMALDAGQWHDALTLHGALDTRRAFLSDAYSREVCAGLDARIAAECGPAGAAIDPASAAAARAHGASLTLRGLVAWVLAR